ncbi:MAG: carboxypeptidase-like regulatory domain-containing protein [Planctomycetota bacterium]
MDTRGWFRGRDQLKTDDQGQFELARGAHVYARVAVLHPRYLPHTVLLPAPGEPAEEPLVRMRRGLLTRGRVVDNQQQPVAGSHVLYTFDLEDLISSDRSAGPVAATSRSALEGCIIPCDADGRFELSCLDPDDPDGYLVAEAEQCFGQIVAVEGLDLSTQELTVTLLRAATVSGTVVDVDGRGVPDVPLRLFPAESDFWLPADAPGGPVKTSTADGSFELSGVPPGCSTLTALWNGSDAAAMLHLDPPLRPGEHRTGLRVHVPYRREVTVLLRGPDGTPLADEPVVAIHDMQGPRPMQQRGTDAKGMARFDLADSGPWTLARARVDGLDLLVSKASPPPTRIERVLSPSPRTRLTVRVQTTEGTPVSDFRLILKTESSTDEYPWTRGVYGSAPTSGLSEVAILRGVPLRGSVWSAVGKSGFRVDPREAVEDILVTIQPTEHVRGRIVDAEGQPVLDAVVRVRGWRDDEHECVLATDAEGRFEAPRHALGGTSFVIDVVPPPGLRSVRELRFSRWDVPLDLVLPPGADITGRVVGPAGSTLEGLEVRARALQPGTSPSRVTARTDAEGAFRIAGVPLAWTGMLELDADQLAGHGLRLVQAPDLVNASDLGVEIRVAAGGAIRGHVEGRTATRGELRVLAYPLDGSQTARRSTSAGADGSFLLDALHDGPHLVELWLVKANSRILLDRLPTRTGDMAAVLRVPELAVITVQLPMDMSPLSIDGIRDDLHAPALTCWGLEGGLQRVLVVKDAAYSLRIHDARPPTFFASLDHGRAGDTIRPRLAGGLRLRVSIEGRSVPESTHVVARSRGKECALESLGFNQFELDVPFGEYEVVVVPLSGDEAVLGRGLRPTGNWHRLSWP